MTTIRPPTVLFVQGAGSGAYAVDQHLASSLRAAPGSAYDVRYPKMPNEADSDYDRWKKRLEKELAALDDGVIFVGHSAGGSMLIRYLAEANAPKSIVGLLLIASPFFSNGGWDAAGWDMPELMRQPTFVSRVIDAAPISLYHSRDDEVVPFEHSRLFKAHVPQATFREYDGRGHRFDNDLTEIAQDITQL